MSLSLHVLTTRWCHCRIDFPLIQAVIVDQNPSDPPVQHYPKLNDNAIALSTWWVLHGMSDRFGFSRTTNLDHQSKKYYFPVALLFYGDQVVAPFSSHFCHQTDIRMANWQVDVYLDKALPSKSVFSLLHDKRGGPPHCFFILPKICQQ